MSPLEYQRLSSAPPPERELLTVDEDGTFRLWRSIAPTVGRFAGTVPDPSGLAALVSAARGSPPPSRPGRLPSGASVEVLNIGDTSARVEVGADVGGPWGALLAMCRDLAGELTNQPLAALALVVEDPAAPRLEHRGREPLPVELDSATIAVDVWHEGVQVVAARAGPLGLGRVMAGPGWSVVFDVGEVAAPSGGLLMARASLVVDDDGVFVPVTVTSPAISL